MMKYQNKFAAMANASTEEIVYASKGRLGSTDRQKHLGRFFAAGVQALADHEFEAARPYLIIDVIQTHWYGDVKAENIYRAGRLLDLLREGHTFEYAYAHRAERPSPAPEPTPAPVAGITPELLAAAMAILQQQGLVSQPAADPRAELNSRLAGNRTRK